MAGRDLAPSLGLLSIGEVFRCTPNDGESRGPIAALPSVLRTRVSHATRMTCSVADGELRSGTTVALRKSDLYASLWASCDQLRGGMDASQYKDASARQRRFSVPRWHCGARLCRGTRGSIGLVIRSPQFDSPTPRS